MLELKTISDEVAIYTIAPNVVNSKGEVVEVGIVTFMIDRYLKYIYIENKLIGKQEVWPILKNVFIECKLEKDDDMIVYEIRRPFIDFLTIAQLQYFFTLSEDYLRYQYITQVFECLKKSYAGQTLEFIAKEYTGEFFTAVFYDANGKECISRSRSKHL